MASRNTSERPAASKSRPTAKVACFDRTPHEDRVIRKIARRAMALETRDGDAGRPFMDWWMDIAATHASGNPLDLERLLAADDFNFAHDVFGICRHLDRETGELRNFFSPRFSTPEAA
jgi:hypothetical protein